LYWFFFQIKQEYLPYYHWEKYNKTNLNGNDIAGGLNTTEKNSTFLSIQLSQEIKTGKIMYNFMTNNNYIIKLKYNKLNIVPRYDL